jgi:hypothetical protein
MFRKQRLKYAKQVNLTSMLRMVFLIQPKPAVRYQPEDQQDQSVNHKTLA